MQLCTFPAQIDKEPHGHSRHRFTPRDPPPRRRGIRAADRDLLLHLLGVVVDLH